MSQTIAYIHTSTGTQDVNNQKLGILEFARQSNLNVDEYVEVTISSRKSSFESPFFKE